jgi:hypothetical protein
MLPSLFFFFVPSRLAADISLFSAHFLEFLCYTIIFCSYFDSVHVCLHYFKRASTFCLGFAVGLAGLFFCAGAV